MEQKIVALLEDLKKLIVLGLVDKGIQGNRIAEVLGVGSATVSRMVSPKKAKKR